MIWKINKMMRELLCYIQETLLFFMQNKQKKEKIKKDIDILNIG
jgi:hypothetical protein